MFSGRITDVGIVTDAGHGLVIEAPKTAGSLAVGGSVNVADACLSAVKVSDSRFRVEVSPETVNRGTLASLQPGGRVNLESRCG
jgi:riboflavin synthase